MLPERWAWSSYSGCERLNVPAGFPERGMNVGTYDLWETLTEALDLAGGGGRCLHLFGGISTIFLVFKIL